MSGWTMTRRGAVAGGFCLCCLPSVLRAEMRVVAVAPGLYVRTGATEDATAANGDAIANIGFIVGRDAVAVVDPGGSLADGEALRRAIRGITDRPIRYVILSHVHPDHVFGAAAFAGERPVFVGHARLPEAIAARGAFYQAGLDKILGAGRAGPVVAPTRLVSEQIEIDLGGRVLALAAHQPAHTTCDLSVMDRQTGTLLTGDLLFVDRVPSLDGNLAGWLGELAGLEAMGASHAVPGHGPALVPWPGAASALRRYLTVLQTETRRAVAGGVPIERAAAEVAASERGRWALFDDYNRRNVIEAYRQIEWE